MNLNHKILKNTSWMIGCRIVQAVLNLLISMLTARYLGPANFGLISYAASITAFAVPVMNLGINSILVNEFISCPDREHEILGTAISMTLGSSLLCILGIGAFVLVANPHEPETLAVCLLYSLALVAQSPELVRYWFQARYLAKYTSLVMLGAYALVSVYKVILLIQGRSVCWFAVANALDYTLISAALLILYRRISGKWLSVSLEMARRLWRNGRYYIVSAMMVTVFAQTDRIMLKLMIDETAVAYYSAAVTVAGMTSFVFAAIIDSMRPAVLECVGRDQQLFDSRMMKLYCVVIYLALVQSLVIALGAPLIIRVLYGEAFAGAVSALRIVVWYTTFSYLGAVRAVWILAKSLQKYLWIINLLGAILNVALNWLLIPVWGINGAAAASLVTQVFANVILGFLIRPIRENNRLILRSLDIRCLRR